MSDLLVIPLTVPAPAATLPPLFKPELASRLILLNILLIPLNPNFDAVAARPDSALAPLVAPGVLLE